MGDFIVGMTIIGSILFGGLVSGIILKPNLFESCYHYQQTRQNDDVYTHYTIMNSPKEDRPPDQAFDDNSSLFSKTSKKLKQD